MKKPKSNETLNRGRIVGRGEMADLIRKFDWASTPLGPIDGWSRELITIVNLTLASSSPARTMWGPEFILIYNDAYRPFPGPRHPQALGKPARLVYEESWQVVGPLLEKAFVTGETLFYEKLLVPLPTGTGVQDFYLNYSFNPIFEDGKIAGLFGPLHNVTDEVVAQRMLSESEARASRILKSIGDAVIVTDAAGYVTLMNPVAEKLTGWTLEEATGQPLPDIFHIVLQDKRQPVESPAETVRRSGKVVGLPNQTLLITKDGSETPIDDSAAPIHDGKGDLTGTVLVFRDVTEKLARETLVQENERRLQTFVDSIPTLAWMAHADGWIFWYNRRWYEYTGTTPKEMEGWGWQTVHDPAALPWVMERWSDAIKTKSPLEMIFPLRGSDGILRPFLTRIVPVRNEFGEVIQWFGTNTEIDELQRIRRSLEESERLARRVLQSIGDAVIVTDAEMRIEQMNPVAEALTGWTIEQSRGRPLSDVFHIVNETTRLTVESPAERVKRKGAIVGLANHTVLLAKNGAETAIDDSAAPIRDEQGALDGIVLVFRDIEERRRSERERERADERLALALSAANGIGIWDWDVREDRVYTDSNFAMMYGVDPEDGARGTSIAAFTANLHPLDAERVGAQITTALETGEDYASEYRVLQPDGSVRWLFAKGRCSYDHEGRPHHFPGVTVDITERIAMEDALRRSEERLRVAMETARLGSWEVDLVTRHMECSALCKANYGRQVEEPFDYADLIACIYPSEREKMQSAVQEAIVTHTPYRHEYRIVWPDESSHWVLASGRVSYGPMGEPLRITGVSLDVTERHQAQAALLQTEKLAAVGRLAASIAHEINNPLESVTNLLYLARTNQNLHEVQEYLATAERELRRASVISNQTLRFYKQSTNATVVTCRELFESVLSIYQGRLVNSRVAVERRERARQPIQCYEGEIRQVLNNLVGNAIDAMHPTGGKLLVRSRDTHNWESGQAGVALTVADNGAGMSATVLKSIFDAFYTTKGIGGTGLGLWVSKEIVDRHRGTIRVRTSQKEGRSGTVFMMFLPYEAAAR